MYHICLQFISILFHTASVVPTCSSGSLTWGPFQKKLLNAGCFSRLCAPRYQHFHFGVPEKCRYRYLGLQVTLPVTHRNCVHFQSWFPAFVLIFYIIKLGTSATMLVTFRNACNTSETCPNHSLILTHSNNHLSLVLQTALLGKILCSAL